MQQLLPLPALPLTEKYEPWTPSFVSGRGLADQAFNLCEKCSHGRLERVLPDLYGSDYLTSTHRSAGATNAVVSFANFVYDTCGCLFDVLIDLGGNDGTLLNSYSTDYGRALYTLVNVDPHASGTPFVIRSDIETVDLSQFIDRKKIIFSSHTIEHLERPEVLIGKAAQIMGDSDCLALQFPSLEMLLEDWRIDQIHHQHIHYFSQKSASKLLYRHGLAPIAWRFDPSHWGALMVVAKKGLGAIAGKPLTIDAFEYAYEQFLSDIGGVIVPVGGVAYGASLMFPILAYWIPDLAGVSLIIDDDTSKDGMRYINFNKRISTGDLSGRDVIITGIGTKAAARALTANAIKAGAQSIVLPLHTL
jgi:hypothetical protein